MPLKFRSSKKKGKGEGDSVSNASIASGTSVPGLDGDSHAGYVIPKEKSLPKLHKAAWKGDLAKLKQATKGFKKNEVNAQDKQQRTALHLACAKGHSDIITHLCSQKASVNVCDSDGCTPMHKSLEGGHPECLQYLLDCGGDANMANKQGCTPLHVAAKTGEVEAATLLLERNARIDAVEKNGLTALHLATLAGHKEFVASILNDGANINATDGQGRTALMLAACEGRIGLVRLLTENEADSDAKDSSGLRAIDYAVSRNHQDCARLVEEYEREVAQKALREQRQPRKTSLVDASLISASFGLGTPAQDRGDDLLPSKSEDAMSHASESQQDSWPISDTDDDLGLDSKPASSKVNLRAGLLKARAAIPKDEPEVIPKHTSPAAAFTSRLPSDPSNQKDKPEKASEEWNEPQTSQEVGGGDPLHYQLNSTPSDGFQIAETDSHGVGSGFDSDDSEDASLPLSSPTFPPKAASGTTIAALSFPKTGSSQDIETAAQQPDHTTADVNAGRTTETAQRQAIESDFDSESEVEGEVTHQDKAAQDDKLPHAPREQKSVEKQDPKPNAQSPDQHGTEPQEEISEMSGFDSDSSLDLDADLPGFGDYNPSSPATASKTGILKQRASLAGIMGTTQTPPERKVSSEKEELNATSPAVPTESSVFAVTPLSSGAFTPDVWSTAVGRSESDTQKHLGKHVQKTAGIRDSEESDESDGGIDELIARAESLQLEKALSFSEQKEEGEQKGSALSEVKLAPRDVKGRESEEKKVAVSEKGEKETTQGREEKDVDGGEFGDSDWDSDDESEEEEEEEGGTALAHLTGTGFADHLLSNPRTRAKATPPKTNYFGYFSSSDSEGEKDEIENAALPRGADLVPTKPGSAAEKYQTPKRTTELAPQPKQDPHLLSSEESNVTSPPKEATAGTHDTPIVSPVPSIPSIPMYSVPAVSSSEQACLASELPVEEAGLSRVRRDFSPIEEEPAHSSVSETEEESEWEREQKARKSQQETPSGKSQPTQIDSGLGTLTTEPTSTEEVAFLALKKAPPTKPLSSKITLAPLSSEGVKPPNIAGEGGVAKPSIVAKEAGAKSPMLIGEEGVKVLPAAGIQSLELKSPPSETLSEDHDLEQLEELLQHSLEDTQTTPKGPATEPQQTDRTSKSHTAHPSNPHSKAVEQRQLASNTGHSSVEESGGRRRRGRQARSQTTVVTAADLQAAELRSALEEDASRKMFERENEYMLLMKVKGKWARETEVSPTHPISSALSKSEPSLTSPTRDKTFPPGCTQLPLMSSKGPESDSEATEVPGIHQGKSKVQLMRQLWESGAIGGSGENVANTFPVRGSKSDSHAISPRERPKREPPWTAWEKETESGKTGFSPPGNGVLPSGALRVEPPSAISEMIEGASPLSEGDLKPATLNGSKNNSSNKPVGGGSGGKSGQEDEILELLSESGSEGEPDENPEPLAEIDTPPPVPPSEAKLPESQATEERQSPLTQENHTSPPREQGESPTPIRQPPNSANTSTLIAEDTQESKGQETRLAPHGSTHHPATSTPMKPHTNPRLTSASPRQTRVNPKTASRSTARGGGRTSQPRALDASVQPLRDTEPLAPVGNKDTSEISSPDSSSLDLFPSYTPHLHHTPLYLTKPHPYSSPLQLHHLRLTPSLPHSLYSTHLTGQSLAKADSHVLERSVSEPISPVETESQSHDLLSESHDLVSDAGNLDDLPFSPLGHLNQSGGDLASSAHVVQLHESLREARRGLERSQDAKATSERARRHLEAQLDESQRKCDEVFGAKLRLENSKLDLELQQREFRYSLEQEREAHRGSKEAASQLREQLARVEGRLGREVEARQAAELRRRELEIEQRALKVANQQLQDRMTDLATKLQSEQDARTLQESLYREQVRVLQGLQEESRKTQEQKTEVLSQLQVADSSRQSLEERVAELQRTNTQLQLDLAVERRRGEDHVTRLEAEVETLGERLQEKTEKQLSAEDALLEARQGFEGTLSELKSKVDLLSSTLDREADMRKRAEGEVSSLQSRLGEVSSELQVVVRREAEGERQTTQTVEEARRERALLERELGAAREGQQQMSVQAEALERRLSRAEGEARSQQALLLERTNQIAVLQREVDQRQLQLQASQEALQREKDQVSRQEGQLGTTGERLQSALGEVAQLRGQVEGAERRAEEREATAKQQQERFDSLLNSIRADYEKSKLSLEERHHSVSEQLVALREDQARREAERSALERDLEKLRENYGSLEEAKGGLEETLRATEEAFVELEGEKQEMEARAEELGAKVAELEEGLGEGEQRCSSLEGEVGGLREALARAKEEKRTTQAKRGELTQQKRQLEEEVSSLEARVGELARELQGHQTRGQQLQGQIQHLSQARVDLQQTASRLQGEVVSLQGELEHTRAAGMQAQREAEEARGLWETEVKSRSKLGMKVLEMERAQTNVSTAVETEKRRVRKALELKKGAELKCESLHRQNSQLGQEVGALKGQLKAAKRRVREMEMNESQLPSLRAEFDRDQLTLQTDLSALRRQLESTHDQLRQESELRVKADQAASRSRQELEASSTRVSLGQSEVQSKLKELHRQERANRKLREEMSALQEHMAASMVERREMEAYKRAVDDKARQELNKKLEEVNAHLEQQAQAQETLQHLRASSEEEWRQKVERNTEELRAQLAHAIADKESTTAEARRFKELYERELQQAERLRNKLQRVKEEALESRTKLSLERNRTQHFLSATQSAAAQLSTSSPPTHHRFTSSTPLKLNLGDHSPTDELLSSVRMELDRSIARHLDSVPTIDSGHGNLATRSTYKKPTLDILLPSKFSAGSKQSHLDAIRRNYHV